MRTVYSLKEKKKEKNALQFNVEALLQKGTNGVMLVLFTVCICRRIVMSFRFSLPVRSMSHEWQPRYPVVIKY